jgi:hypothetical protein
MLDMVERSVFAMLVECVVERERPSNEVCRVFKDRFIDSCQRPIISSGVAWMVGSLRRRGVALLNVRGVFVVNGSTRQTWTTIYSMSSTDV